LLDAAVELAKDGVDELAGPMAALGLGLLGLAIVGIARPSPKASFALFKFASVYMLGAMLIVAATA